MICAVISDPIQLQECHQEIDLVELRLDLFPFFTQESIKILRYNSPLPMIFTLRSVKHQTERERIKLIEELMQLKPEYFDLEMTIPNELIEQIHRYSPLTKIILSFHDFESTPNDDELDLIYGEMQKKRGDFYKIAVQVKTTNDALRLMVWTKKQKNPHLISIGMGPLGQITRILAPLMNVPITYTCIKNEPNQLGQLSAEILTKVYHWRSLNTATTIYGLIGSPVNQSPSHFTHNHVLGELNLNSVYVKMIVEPEQIETFLKYAKELPFCGLSVTIPLKETVLLFLDKITPKASEIGAVNTLLFKKGKLFGENTDAQGALDALEELQSVKGKKIIIIGAGGSAKAIAYEGKRRGALITIVNRNQQRAEKLAKDLKCKGVGLDVMKECFFEGYDFLINTTPTDPLIESHYFLPDTIVMDIRLQANNSSFLMNAKRSGCKIIQGDRMFIKQAAGQFSFWFDSDFFKKSYLS